MRPVDSSPRRFTRRDIVRFGLGLPTIPTLLAACSQPADARSKPTTAPIAPKDSPNTTNKEAQKSPEKDTVDGWKITPVSFEDVKIPNLDSSQRMLHVAVAMQNVSNQVRYVSAQRPSENAMQRLSIRVQAAGGFRYPESDGRERASGFGVASQNGSAHIPPSLGAIFDFTVIVPKSARDLQFVMSSKDNPSLQKAMSLERDFPPEGKRNPVEFLSRDGTVLKRLGQPTQQGPLSVTPQDALLVLSCDGYANEWKIALKQQMQNNHGYALGNPDASVAAFDEKGRIRNTFNNPTEEMPAGTTKTTYSTAFASERIDSRNCTTNIPEKPGKLQVVVYLPPLKKIGVPEAWSIYDTGTLRETPPQNREPNLPALFGA